MVLPAPAAHDPEDPETAGWAERVARLLRLGRRGILILVDQADGARLRELFLALLPEYPELELYTDPRALIDLPEGSTLVLAPSAEHADWLNINRPVFAARALRVVLWCDAETSKALARRATDFFDWISHRVECPPGVPAFAVAGLRSALCARAPGVIWRGERLEQVFRVALPGRRLRFLSAKASWGSLGMSLKKRGRDWLAFVDLESEHRVHLLQLLCVRTGIRGRVVFVNPGAGIAGCLIVQDRLLGIAEARAKLLSSGATCPGRLAALAGLEPEAVDLAQMLLEREVAEQDITSAAREGGEPDPALVRLAAGRGFDALVQHVVSLQQRAERDPHRRQAQRIAWLTEGRRTRDDQSRRELRAELIAEVNREKRFIELIEQTGSDLHQAPSPEQLAIEEKNLREALAVLEQGVPQSDFFYLFVLNVLALMLVAQSRLEEAEILLRRELAIEESLGAGRDNPIAETLDALARILRAQGRPEEAETFARRAQELTRAGGA